MVCLKFKDELFQQGLHDLAWSLATSDECESASSLVTARQAWQFAVIPLAKRGDSLTYATSSARRERAERFVERVLELQGDPLELDEPTLAACLNALYPLGGAPVAISVRPTRSALAWERRDPCPQ